MSRLGLAGVGEDDANSYQVYKINVSEKKRLQRCTRLA